MKHAGNFIGIAAIFCVFFFGFVELGLWIIDFNPPQLPPTVTLGEWKASFQLWISVCVGCAGASSLLWYVLAQWIFKINRWKDTDKRSTWIWLLLLTFVASIISAIFVKRVESSLTWIYLFFFLTGLFHYYIATVLFSPSSFKFTPLGAKYIRYW